MPTLVCTGCSSGLGIGALSQWCRRLVSRSPPRPPCSTQPWRILAGQRAPLDSTPTPEQRALAALCAAHPHTLRLEWLALDLADSHSVRAFARQVRARTDKVDALVLNAAVWTADADEAGVDVDGQERTQEAVVNALAQHLLVDLLSPLLVAAETASSSSARSRIVVTTSKLHSSVTSLDELVAQLHPPTSTTSRTGKSRYAASKALQLVSAAYWATRLADSGVDVVAVSPGFVPTTALSRAQSPFARWAMRNLVSWLPFAVSAEEGAARIARCFPLGAEPHPHARPSSSSSSSPPGAPSSPSLNAATPTPPQHELLPLFDALRAASSTEPGPSGSPRRHAAPAPPPPPPLLYLTAASSAPLAAPPPARPRAALEPSSAARLDSRAAPTPALEPPHDLELDLDLGGGIAQALIARACAVMLERGGGSAGVEQQAEEDEGEGEGEGAVRAPGWDEVGRAVLGRRAGGARRAAKGEGLGEGEGEGEGEGWGAVGRWEWGAGRAAAYEEGERVRDELGVD